MTAVIEARGLGKRYRRRWALPDCTLEIPAGHVTGLVGPNGAGKTTLLSLAVGLLAPTAGTIEVCGGRPGRRPEQLAKVGFVAQDTPTYAGLTVADHLRLGAHLNPRWDDAARPVPRSSGSASTRPRRPAGSPAASAPSSPSPSGWPSGRSCCILDEPVASLDPLARREFLQVLMEAVAEHGLSVLLSSHVVVRPGTGLRPPASSWSTPRSGSRATSRRCSPRTTG